MTLPSFRVIAGTIAAVAIVSFAANKWHNRGVDRAADAVVTAVDSTIKAISVADSATSVAAAARARADSLEKLNAGLYARVSAAEQSAAALRDKFRHLPKVDSTALATANAAFRLDSVALVASELAYSNERNRSQSLQVGLDTTTAALTRLRAAAVNLGGKATTLVASVHRPFLLRILPRPGVGVALGVDRDLKPHQIVAVTLGWTF